MTDPFWKVTGTLRGLSYSVVLQATDWNDAVRRGSNHPHMLCVRSVTLEQLEVFPAILIEEQVS